MPDSLTYVDKCMVAAMATMNASYLSREGNVRSASNAAIETMQIKTLAEYYKGDPEKLKTYDPSKMDNDKLMRSYVIPLVLDNGETIDLIVNSKGQDMACVYLDEDSKESQFALTPRMKTEIENAVKKNGINGIKTKMDISEIEKMMQPDTLEEFTEAVSKDNLVPKSPRDTIAKVKSKDENADIQMANDEVFEIEDEENKTPEEIQNDISLEEKRLQGIAEKAGMSLEDIKKFCLENRLTSKAIKGAREIVDVDGLENALNGTQLDDNSSSSVVVIKTQEEGLKNRARIVNKSGHTKFDNPKYDEQLLPLVPETQTVEAVKDYEKNDKSKKYEDIVIKNDDNETTVEYIEGNKTDTAIFEEKFNKLQLEYKQKLEKIENSDKSPVEKSEAKEELAGEFYASVIDIERQTGVNATEVKDKALDNAEDAVIEDDKTKITEGMNTLGEASGAVVGAVVGATMAENALMSNKENEHNHPEEHHFPEGPWDNPNNHH